MNISNPKVVTVNNYNITHKIEVRNYSGERSLNTS
jgi:hypothetical protein